MSALLDWIQSPEQLRKLSRDNLLPLAAELRERLIQSVSQTGGHFSSNLGTVELTIALHYVFNTPEDRLVWDVGHQTYPHKMLTGRNSQMASMRQLGGLSGFPRREESIYDAFGTVHSQQAWPMRP
jgi:1-deoxy-D-xylulose-5-phosphate synthase